MECAGILGGRFAGRSEVEEVACKLDRFRSPVGLALGRSIGQRDSPLDSSMPNLKSRTPAGETSRIEPLHHTGSSRTHE